MSQSHYHVFLPPTLSPLEATGVIPRLVFQDLVVPRDVESQLDFGRSSQVERLKRISLSRSQAQPQPQSLSLSRSNFQGEASIEGSNFKGKGKLLEDDLSLIDHPLPPRKAKSLQDNPSLIDHPPLPPTFVGGHEEVIAIAKRKSIDDGNTSLRSVSIKKSRAPLQLSGNTAEDEDDSVELEVGVGVGDGGETGLRSRRRSSRVRRSTSGLLGTFPVDSQEEESYLSLNTTISSLPPSGEVASVLNLPKWSIPITKLSSLPTLLTSNSKERERQEKKISVIVCILSVETPVLRQRKEEKRKGEEGTLWIGGWVVTAPNTWPGYAAQGDGAGCGVKLCGEVARDWGEGVVRKGDVVLLENVAYKPPLTDQSAQISISATPPSKIQILYRTLPHYHLPSNPYIHTTAETAGAKVVPGDRELRPDLRLGRSDLGVRRVGEIVRWFAGFIGGDAPL